MAEARSRDATLARREANWSLLSAVSVALVAALGAPSCLERRDADPHASEVTRCATCHGDPEREGDYLERAAPPRDMSGASETNFPGVGAHQIHLRAGADHGPVACQECHVVPDSTDAPGHDDSARPAEITFGALARTGERQPQYDAAVKTCESSYCHGSAKPLWTEPRDKACGTCHDLPPAAPHPQSDKCSACHGEVIDAERKFIHPERHVDGVVDYVAGDCQICHGNADNAAPPLDTLGNEATTARGVGAHQAHLAGGQFGRPLACSECHVVPEQVEDPTHVDAAPAEVFLSGIAQTGGRAPQWEASSATCTDSWCHSPSDSDQHPSPVWNAAAQDTGCQTCHGAPPPAPHPQMSNCSHCHGDVVADDNETILDRELHVNGHVDVSFDQSCNSCHGDKNAAPPLDVAGNETTAAPGVGAHQSHLANTGRARPVPCSDCHVVPQSVLAAGHMDSDRPAELTFSGAATANGATPSYQGGTCQNTACHGAVLSEGPSGGSNTAPTWTVVDGTQAACGACHALPPPPPHPLPTYPCHQCHFNLNADDVTFNRPDLHVDGKVTLQLP
jgi:predicted CxxxxCH...CXXCH cytochrome family protein